MKIVINSLLWIFFVCLIGGAQIGIIYLYSRINGLQMENLDKFYSDGFFLFFSISLIAGIFYEFQFENSCRVHKSVKNALLIFSGGLGIFAMLTYALAFASRIEATNNISSYISTQNYLTSATVLVSVTMKGIIYYSK
jgi:hypothetical protein